jgi:hypothetical protein
MAPVSSSTTSIARTIIEPIGRPNAPLVHWKRERDTRHPSSVGAWGVSAWCSVTSEPAPWHATVLVAGPKCFGKLDDLRGIFNDNSEAQWTQSRKFRCNRSRICKRDSRNGRCSRRRSQHEAMTVAATVGIVAVGAALFEVALLPGIALGVAAMLAPKYVPKMGAALTPVFRSTVRGAYKFGQRPAKWWRRPRSRSTTSSPRCHAEGDVVKAAAEPAADAQKV